MTFEKQLERAAQGVIDESAALQILTESQEPQKALKLFETASYLRDKYLGPKLWWSGGPSAVIPCKIIPRCKYCTFFARTEFSMEYLRISARAVADRGIKYFILSGGTNLEGYDQEVLDMIKVIQDTADLDIFVNLGPSFSENTVRKMKSLGIRTITSSLEIYNQELFAQAKPGDTLSGRKRLLDICEQEGLFIRSMILIGLGETYKDRIDHLLYLRQFKSLSILNVSRFYPYPDISYANRPRCSPWEMARTVAVARLILPWVDIGFGAGHTPDDIPLWYLAGGGNKLIGTVISPKNAPPRTGPMEEVTLLAENLYEINRMPIVQHYVESIGRDITFDRPNKILF